MSEKPPPLSEWDRRWEYVTIGNQSFNGESTCHGGDIVASIQNFNNAGYTDSRNRMEVTLFENDFIGCSIIYKCQKLHCFLNTIRTWEVLNSNSTIFADIMQENCGKDFILTNSKRVRMTSHQ